MKQLVTAPLLLILAVAAQPHITFGQLSRKVLLPKDKYESVAIVKSDRVTKVPESRDEITVRQGELLAARTVGNAVATEAGDKLKIRIPYQLSYMTPAGNAVDMQPVVEVEGGGFRPRRGALGFHGSLQLGLENTSDPTASDILEQDVNILVTAVADSVSRANLTLHHTNQPYEPVSIFATSPQDSVKVRIKPSFDEGIEISIPVLRPKLSISVSPENGIPGYGLGTAKINVQMSGVPDPTGMAVTLTSDLSEPEPSRIVLDAFGGGEATIRSSGRGRATLKAMSLLSQPATRVVAFLFPTAFLIFATVGGLLGGLAKFLRDRLDPSRKAAWKTIGLYLLSGLVFGFIVAGLSAIGINVSPVKPTANAGEALVCFLSALGGFAGSTLLSSFLGMGEKAASA